MDVDAAIGAREWWDGMQCMTVRSGECERSAHIRCFREWEEKDRGGEEMETCAPTIVVTYSDVQSGVCRSVEWRGFANECRSKRQDGNLS